MIGKKAIKYTIEGIYGGVTNADLSLDIGEGDTYNKARHSYIEKNTETFEDIKESDEIPNLPLDIDMDEYFKIALIQTIKDINKTNSRDSINTIGNELKKLNNNIERLIDGIHMGKTENQDTEE